MPSEVTHAALPAELTLVSATSAERALVAAMDQAGAGEFTVDAGGVQQLDSAALAVLLELHRAARARGRTVRIVQAPAKLAQLATLYGVADLLGLAPVAAPAPGAH